jgi:hypothetical protein
MALGGFDQFNLKVNPRGVRSFTPFRGKDGTFHKGGCLAPVREKLSGKLKGIPIAFLARWRLTRVALPGNRP